MSLRQATMPELNRKAFEILARELGLADTVRFFGQLGLGDGNYTTERREMFAGLTLDDYRNAISTESAPSSAAKDK